AVSAWLSLRLWPAATCARSGFRSALSIGGMGPLYQPGPPDGNAASLPDQGEKSNAGSDIAPADADPSARSITCEPEAETCGTASREALRDDNTGSEGGSRERRDTLSTPWSGPAKRKVTLRFWRQDGKGGASGGFAPLARRLVVARRRVAWGRRVTRRRCVIVRWRCVIGRRRWVIVIGRGRGCAGRHALRVIRVVLLLYICRRVLGISDAGAAADDRTRGRPDPGATAAADRPADRRSETGAEKSATESLGVRLGIGLVTQHGRLRVGILPARLIIVIRLRHHPAARRERRQNCANKTSLARSRRSSLRWRWSSVGSPGGRAFAHPGLTAHAGAGPRRAVQPILQRNGSFCDAERSCGRDKEPQSRHRRMPGDPARYNPDRQAHRVDRSGLGRAFAIRHRRRRQPLLVHSLRVSVSLRATAIPRNSTARAPGYMRARTNPEIGPYPQKPVAADQLRCSPMSSGQLRAWFVEQLSEGAAVNNLFF